MTPRTMSAWRVDMDVAGMPREAQNTNLAFASNLAEPYDEATSLRF
jgi:hypothetical protein